MCGAVEVEGENRAANFRRIGLLLEAWSVIFIIVMFSQLHFKEAWINGSQRQVERRGSGERAWREREDTGKGGSESRLRRARRGRREQVR